MGHGCGRGFYTNSRCHMYHAYMHSMHTFAYTKSTSTFACTGKAYFNKGHMAEQGGMMCRVSFGGGGGGGGGGHLPLLGS